MEKILTGSRSRSWVVAIPLLAGLAYFPTHRAVAAEWAQAHSDVPADADVLFGTLPNGMRYAIKRNAAPKGAVALRLAIEAGSLEESDAQQGLAHFLEHMAFRGSRHVPEKEVWPGLQRLGMATGADSNASTAFTQTLYQFNLPRNDSETVAGGLMRLREIASELTLDQRAMNDERGVILSEERLRDTPSFRMEKALIGLVAPGKLPTRRQPIGLTDIIKNAPVSLIRDFYEAYYRPDRAAVIVVGDIDPKTIEAKIVADFSSWKGVGSAGSDPKIEPPANRGPHAELFVDAGAPALLAMAWTHPPQPDTLAREQEDLNRIVAFQILSYRLQDLAAGPQHPFGEAESEEDRLFHSIVLQSVMVTIQPQKWRVALDAAITAVRRIEQYGVTDDELKRAEDNITAIFQSAVARADTRPSPDVADEIAKSIDEGEVFESPAEQLARATAQFQHMTAADVTKALRNAMHDHGPLVLLSSPVAVEGGATALSTALAAAEKAPLTAATAQAAVIWPYLSFGAKNGEVVERKDAADLDVSMMRFANGVRLTVRPTHYAAGQVAVEVNVGGGRLDLPPHRDTPRWAVGSGFIASGTKQISFDEMRRVLAGKVIEAKAALGDDGLKLWGMTRPADLPTQLQVFAAYVTQPGWRPEGVSAARTAAANALAEADASPDGVQNRDVPLLLHGGDRRWAQPTAAEIAALTPKALEDMLAPALAAGPIEVTIVGDITPDAAQQAMAATFGALPPRGTPPAPSADALAVHFPPGTAQPVMLHHHGRADQGIAAIGWPTAGLADQQSMANLRVLRAVMDTRLMDQLRIREGATYSPELRLRSSKAFSHYGYLFVATELPPAKMPLFFSIMAGIVGDLKAHPVASDELERARGPVINDEVTERQDNDHWIEALIGAQTDPQVLADVRDRIPDLRQVTAASLQHAAETYLADAAAWKLEITPEAAAPSH